MRFQNSFFQGIILYISSKNEYPENPTLAWIVLKLRSTTTRVDLHLEPPPPLSFGHPALSNVKNKSVSVLLMIFKHF